MKVLELVLKIWSLLSSKELNAMYIEDIPDTLDKKIVYIVGTKSEPYYGALICPCGCNQTIYLNFMKSAHPRWTVKNKLFQGVSLSPSIWRIGNCSSHFFIKNGKVIWCN